MATDLAVPALEVPPLCAGDRLTRAEFERRWDAMPEVEHAELLNGVVHMAAALSIDHGAPHFDVITWLGLYRILTPGVGGADNTSVRLDADNMPQPDALLRVLESHGGRCRVTADRFLEGGPELIVEIAKTSADDDLGPKQNLYRRHGVSEYIVWRVADGALTWFALKNGLYWPMEPGDDGITRSAAFPGLWLDVPALLRGDAARVLTVAQQGHGSAEHTAFVAELCRRAGA